MKSVHNLTPESVKWQKRPKLITQKSVNKFRNLLQCQRNTRALTTENVRLFKTVYRIEVVVVVGSVSIRL